MREIQLEVIIDSVKNMCIEANYTLPLDVSQALQRYKSLEQSPIAVKILDDLMENAKLAVSENIPMCQDTGMAVFFVRLGQDVRILGGLLTDAINEGVRQGYKDGYLRKSVVGDPLNRKNTMDNTPAVIHIELVQGENLEIQYAPKGFGSENMSRSAMLIPSDGVEGVVAFVVETVSKAGSNPCPPIVVGVGIGGTLDKAAQIAKRALLRPIGSTHEHPYYAALEERILGEVNALGIGPQGLGGNTTALAVHIDYYPTHIAGLPVVVNLNCHAARHSKVIL
jgi:fumarate hydratase subunit alpha